MPRILLPRRRVPLTPEQIRDRNQSYRITRQFAWVDPFPEVYGTKPEKMVYAELVRRGITFQYVPDLNTGIPDLEINQWFKPDFVIPQFRYIIEVQGAYWHTKSEKIESDSLRFALFEMAGWRVLAWWDYDIENKLQDLFNEVPEFRVFQGGGKSPGRSTFVDDLKGLRKANQKRRKPWTKKPVMLKEKRTSKLVKGVSAREIKRRRRIF